MSIVLAEYGKASEHPFPTVVEDAWAPPRGTDSALRRRADDGGRVPAVVRLTLAVHELTANDVVEAVWIDPPRERQNYVHDNHPRR
ncbi:hypothetical protein [Sinomonas mesophila]|uniref:hypothetical protein n=1 Tax=Sinomonas mesophila TaxID=1531955 RepID=UPI0011157BE6|nr:hypothetical protein [Sinomonas mesophila]